MPADLVSQVFSFSPPAARCGYDSSGRSPSSPVKPVQSVWCPVTATHHWRRGPRWPVKMAPSPAAANIFRILRAARLVLAELAGAQIAAAAIGAPGLRLGLECPLAQRIVESAYGG